MLVEYQESSFRSTFNEDFDISSVELKGLNIGYCITENKLFVGNSFLLIILYTRNEYR